MAISNERSGIVFHCDAKRCANVCETQLDDFQDALTEMKDKGWKVRFEADGWKHYCEDEVI